MERLQRNLQLICHLAKGTRNEGTVAIVTVKYEILTGGYWLCVRVQGVAINVSPWL